MCGSGKDAKLDTDTTEGSISMRFYVLATLALAGTSLPLASATAQSSYQTSRLLKTIDEAALVATLESMGVEHGTDKGTDGSTLYTIDYQNGFKAFSYFRACEDGCKGLVLIGVFSPPENMTPNQLRDTVREFNDRYPAAKLYVAESGDTYSQSYVIFDEGITMGNLKAQLEVFGDIGAEVSDKLYSDD
ncbi:hypothetical protein GRI89_06155 [Altererythrobacter salegens]|uniref:YbjN domain-containing protein n=1 Tax=Croceibacterium salegens TaxID=1737568 RepID=A0A6I4SSZ1_9SPHN|nr:YbjN domain-containing protein [Croceibacterium salegens]MXO59121.1 hypothetical protein [Croceibacterium salegens]